MRATRDVLIGLRHCNERILINYNVGAQYVQQCKEVVITRLKRCSSKHNNSICVLTEILHALVGERLFFVHTAVTDMMCLIDDDQIEVRGRIQIGQSVGFSFFTFFTLINSAIQNRVRNNGLVIANRPFSVPIRIRNDLTKLLSRNGNEFLIKTLHFIFPFTFRYKRLGANDKYIFKLVTSLQLFDNQACFNRFTDTNAIRNQNARFVRLDKLQCRSELIRHKINSRGV